MCRTPRLLQDARMTSPDAPRVLIPIPSRDFDPTEAAVSWQVLTQHGMRVHFATPDGVPGQADEMMLSGQGLDLSAHARHAKAEAVR